MTRREGLGLLVAALLTAAVSGAAWAEEKGGGEAYVKLSPIAMEFWDADGLFHTVNVELTAVFPGQVSVNKKIADQIQLTLSSMTWEDFSKGNPAATIKGVALNLLRKDPSGANAIEVLVQKLVIR